MERAYLLLVIQTGIGAFLIVAGAVIGVVGSNFAANDGLEAAKIVASTTTSTTDTTTQTNTQGPSGAGGGSAGTSTTTTTTSPLAESVTRTSPGGTTQGGIAQAVALAVIAAGAALLPTGAASMLSLRRS